MPKNAIEVKGLAVSLDGKPIFGNVNAEVEEGSCLALLGPSGAGKTTLLRAIAGFIRPTKGTIKILGEEMQGAPPERRPVSMLFQIPALFDDKTVEENALFGVLRMKARQQALQRVQQLAETFDFAKFLKRQVSGLSGGERQRAAFIRTFANAKKIMLLDEPIGSAFDLHQRRELLCAIKECTRQDGLTTILVTHEFEEAAYLSDKVLVLYQGKSSSKKLHEMYSFPENQHIARVMGYGNEIDADILLDGNRREKECPVRIIGALGYHSEAACAFFRPSSVEIIPEGVGFVVESLSFFGALNRVVLRPQNGSKSIEVVVPTEKQYTPGSSVGAKLPADSVIFFKHNGEKAG